VGGSGRWGGVSGFVGLILAFRGGASANPSLTILDANPSASALTRGHTLGRVTALVPGLVESVLPVAC